MKSREDATCWLVATLVAAALCVRCSHGAPPEPAPAAGSTEPVTWSAVVPQDVRLVSGGTAKALLTAKIGPGWHMYAMSQTGGGPTPLTIELPATTPFTLSGPVVEPEPKKALDPNFNIETRFFETEATFTLPLRIAANTQSGAHALNIDARFQVCNARLCMPAQTVPVSVDAKVEAK